MISNPSVNNANDVHEKHCDGYYEAKSITYDIDNDDDDNDDDDDSPCQFVKPRTPWYGSAFIHWLAFDIIG